jgi:hypothetical protein
MADVAGAAVRNYVGNVKMRQHTSLYTPSGWAAKWLWSCIYPASVPNKAYSLQIAMLILADGAEICFCMGAGRDMYADSGEKGKHRSALDELRLGLTRLLPKTVKGVGESLQPDWKFRRQWKLGPGASDFAGLVEWLTFAASADGDGASISLYLSPEDLEKLGSSVLDHVLEFVRVFHPIFEELYGGPEVIIPAAEGKETVPPFDPEENLETLWLVANVLQHNHRR